MGEGFEPSKSVTADLQSAPFGRSGTPPYSKFLMVPAQESNSGPTDYKSVALPTELCRHQVLRILGSVNALCNKKIAFLDHSVTKRSFLFNKLFFSKYLAQIINQNYL